MVYSRSWLEPKSFRDTLLQQKVHLSAFRSAMSNYVPHYTKRKQLLARREAQLARLISSGTEVARIVLVAQEVKEGRIHVLKARLANIVPKEGAVKVYESIDRKIQKTEQLSIEAILSEFGYRKNDEDF